MSYIESYIEPTPLTIDNQYIMLTRDHLVTYQLHRFIYTQNGKYFASGFDLLLGS